MTLPESPSRLYLLTYPRTASNLFVRMLALEEQDNVLPCPFGGYFYLPIVEGRSATHLETGRHIAEWSEEERTKLFAGLQSCTKTFQEYADAAQAQGKIAFVKEHTTFLTNPVAATKWLHGEDSTREEFWTVDACPNPTRTPGNDTIFSDEFLSAWTPTFLIRHPAMVFPSFCRAMNDMQWSPEGKEKTWRQSLYMTMRWSRRLYDWYTQKLGKTESQVDNETKFPVIIDADDVMTNPQVVVKFSKMAGLDPTKVRFTWQPKTTEELEKMSAPAQRMLSTISSSSGILKDKVAANIDVDEEARKWKQEFGEVVGKQVEDAVRAAIPDYEYMRERRLRP